MKREIIPFSYLFLYSKGWIRFRDSKGFIDDIRRIIKMDGYFPDKNPTGQVLNALHQIKEFYQRHNRKLGTEWDDFGYFYRQAKSRYISDKELKANPNISEIEYGMIWEAYGMIQCLKLENTMSVKFIPYDQWKVVCASAGNGTTYKQMNHRFNKMFKDILVQDSFVVDWYTENTIKNRN